MAAAAAPEPVDDAAPPPIVPRYNGHTSPHSHSHNKHLTMPLLSEEGPGMTNGHHSADNLPSTTKSATPSNAQRNRSNDKMLKAEKVLGIGNVKRASSVPMLNKNTNPTVDPQKLQRDELVMDTNKSSIVSKRSVEKLYFQNEPEYFRYFVTKFKRRSPLINRGYWLRMKAVQHAVSRFLSERTAKKKVVINLGCGYDPLPFSYLGKNPALCQGTTFVDVDYPTLMHNKVGIIDKTEPLRCLLPKFTRTANDRGLLASSDPYVAIGCDLTDLIPLQEVLQDHLQLGNGGVAILFVSEVSTAYMEREGSQAVYNWAATYDDVRFCLLEQHLPDGTDHPFAATMLSHFEKLRTPLRAVGTMEQMEARFVAAGFPEGGTEIRTLWDLWSDPGFLTAEERRALDRVEPFDEWEEFALFGSHYFLLMAEKEPDRDYTINPNSPGHAARRTSIFSGSTRGTSVVSTPTNGNHSPDTPQYHFAPGDILQTHELLEPHNFRRFAQIVPPPETDSHGDTVGQHGGVGTQERLDSCNTFSRYDAVQPITGPPLRTGLVCHQVTRLGTTANCVLTGGRTSPDKASAESWLRLDGKWRRVQDLPSGRYRHCAVPLVLPTEPRPAHTVLLFGGKTSDGRVLDQWLIWTGETGWQTVKVVGDTPPARFGATMCTDGRESTSGVLVGGMTSAGRVLNDFWHWSLEHDMTLTCRNVTSRATAFLKADACLLGRFGAQLVRSNRGILMIGGITGARMLTRQDEVLNLKTLRPQPIQGPRPLFIGHALHDVDGGLLVLGGGATCFSFGTTWNRSCILNDVDPGKFAMEWRLQCTLEAGKPTTEQSTIFIESSPSTSNGTPVPKMPEPLSIQAINLENGVNFGQYVSAARPVILKKCSIGDCTTSWTSTQYLKEAVGVDRKVAVHSSPATEKMDFAKKNFEYITQDFGSFLDSVERGERVYLRALSKEAPSDKPTSLAEDFPNLAKDFELPPELDYVVQNTHSSPLRISGPVQMWLHYDVMANVLCQVRGRKRLLLFPPADISHLGFEAGASSSSVDVFGSAPSPGLANTHPHEAVLEPGDVLFIPPMWVHTVAPAENGMSIAVNVFFRNLKANGYAAGRDVYGNRDLAAYERGRKDVARIVKSVEELPADVGAFYLERLANEMLEKARIVRGSAIGGGGAATGVNGNGNVNGLHSVHAELP